MRIRFLDGLRGLAILLVLAYHAYCRWADRLPYGDAWASFPPVKHGWLGVELFFLISGFVIHMSLEKTDCMRMFVYKRWLRLFPAMLIATVLIYSTAGLFPERPYGSPSPFSVIPGLTFIEPYWWERLLGRSIPELEGVFWSLYVEFKFYIIAAIIYFYASRRALPVILGLLFLFSIATELAPSGDAFAFLKPLKSIATYLSLNYFAWFSAGAFYYRYFYTRSRLDFTAGSVVALAGAVQAAAPHGFVIIVAVLFIPLVFAFAVLCPRFQILLSNRLLLFLGFASYPLYLIHENLMISLIVKLGRGLPVPMSLALSILVIAALAALAYGIAYFLEPPLQRFLRRKLDRWLAAGRTKGDRSSPPSGRVS